MKHTVFQLGEWLVEPDLKRLSKDGLTFEVEPKTMAVLIFLIEHADEVVSSAELILAVWQNRPMGDNPVYKAIAKLRSVLGDDPQHPKYIATVTRLGYRLIAPVSPLNENEAFIKPPTTQITVWRALIYLSMLLLVLLLAWLGQQIWMGGRGSENIEPQIQQLVTLPGSSSQATYSPDGTRLIFVNDSSGIGNLWSLKPGQVTAEQLTFFKTPVSSPAWSPAGQSFLFVRNGSIWQMQNDSEAELLIEHANFPAWSPDGQQIVFEREAEVWTSAANGDQQRKIESISGKLQLFAPRQPAFSPDGRSLVYFDGVQGPAGDFWIVDIETNEIRQLTFDGVIAGKAQFTDDGQWIVFDSTRGGTQSLWRVWARGGKPQQILHSTSNDMLSTLGSDNRSLIYTSTSPRWSLVLSDPVNKTSEVLFASRFHTMGPELSPDGSQLTFFSGGLDGSTHIYSMSMANRTANQLTFEPRAIDAIPRWSGDGRWIYYYHSSEGNNNAWQRVNVASGKTEVVVPGWEFSRQHDASIDPTGSKILYAQLEGSNVMASKIKTISSGAEIPLATRLSWPEWSRDGGKLLATDFTAGPLPVGPVLLCDSEGELPDNCRHIAARGQHPLWSADENAAYYVNPVSANVLEVWRYNFEDGTNEMIMPLFPTAVDIAPFFDVTTNERIIWVRFDKGLSELWQMTW